MHIAIAGNIGSGKTTLTRMLAKTYGWTPFYEAVETNPYIEDYYKDIPRWSFNMEVFFLRQRFRDLVNIAGQDCVVLQDRSIFEGVYVFTANNRAMGNLSERDYETYMELFESMMLLAEMPELMIYLRASVPHLVGNIQKRGRNYEQTIQLEYLQNLNNLYEDFIYNKYKGRVLTIEVDNMDFEHNPDDYAKILNKIDGLLFGLFGPDTNTSQGPSLFPVEKEEDDSRQSSAPAKTLGSGKGLHLAVAGNIGCGKTTLTRMLAKRYGWEPRYEPVDNNPYLADFYADMKRWSYNLQIYFLNKRFKEVVEIARSNKIIIQDRTIFEDARIFATNLHRQGMMSDRDFENYEGLFDLMMELIKLPDLMIYIRSSIPTLIAQIQKRGREYEQTMRIDYLQGLAELYEQWIAGYKGRLIVIDGDHLKFGDNPEDFERIADMIDAKLFGLFPDE